MLIFIRLLPESVTQGDLRKFVSGVIRPAWRNLFSSRGAIHATEIRKLTNRATHSVEYHGIVDIEPATAAMAAIRKLNRASLKGKEVEVRKYYRRSPLRDRRENERRANPAAENRRKSDRRRDTISTERVSMSGPLQVGPLQSSKSTTEMFQVIS